VQWRCPVCAGPLALAAQGASCKLGHHFDRARQGYINLLPAQHKASRDPGDDAGMMAARHEFLQAGYYQPLAESILALLAARLLDGGNNADNNADNKADHNASSTPAQVLDCGCGEGYYTGIFAAGLDSAGLAAQVAGIDISRAALRMAARQYKQVAFAVASNFHLPVADDQVDIMTRIFAPGDDLETLRVLAPGGWLIVAYPGPRHLFELKAGIYSQPTEHLEPALPAGFACMQSHRVQFPLELQSRAAIDSLLKMTPFAWAARQQSATAFDELDRLTTSADFLVRCYQASPA
jgi:23S rRNA (guanine745-N1)-methyltransferase